MQFLVDGRSQDFQKNFCGTHFFNPPRYLRLLEIIPAPSTSPEVIDFLMHYGDLFLGKEAVLCKDTPAFIANRVGIYAIMSGLHTVEKMGLTVGEVDKLTGPVIGRPKSATFRTLDVVGLDTMVKVAGNLSQVLQKDESKEKFNLPDIVKKAYDNKWWGDKTKQGFYKKTKDEKGKKQILELNLKTFEYQEKSKVNFEVLGNVKDNENLKERIQLVLADEGKAGEFYRASFYDLFKYCSLRIPEIADDLYNLDKAVCAGFGWELGPFATWDSLGVANTITKMKESGYPVANWVTEMIDAGFESFYKEEAGEKKYYDIATKSYKVVPGSEGLILLNTIRKTNVVWENAGATLFDLGDDVLGLEFHSKMNSLGAEVIEGVNTGIAKAEEGYKGLVIGNEGANFSAGANLSMLFMAACDQEFDEVEMMVNQFQKTVMKMRFSNVPVVAATAGMAIGGGCELSMHCDAIQAHCESYIGLVEVGVGVIPAGCGTKELALRCSDKLKEGDPELNRLQSYFMNIATAKVATSAHEAMEMDYINEEGRITMNRSRLIADAKARVLELYNEGYTQPAERKDIKVQGRSGMALFEAGITQMLYGNYISEHDAIIAGKLSLVIYGGVLRHP